MTSSKSKLKAKVIPCDSGNSSPVNDAPPLRPMLPIRPIATLIPDLDCGETSPNRAFPLSCARDEPGVHIPSPPPPKRGQESRSGRSCIAVKPPATTQSANSPLQDQENNPPLASQVVEKAKTKRGKTHVPKSSRNLRPRGCQLVVKPEKEPSHGNTNLSALQATQGNGNDEPLYWEVSWDKWTHVRGTIRRAKTRSNVHV